MQDKFKALSVQNPWGWALVTKGHNGKPLKPVENRTSPLGYKNHGKWVLIHVGHSHKPDPDVVSKLRDMTRDLDVEMPDWAGVGFKKIGAIVGAVLFADDTRPKHAWQDPYARLWITPRTETPDRRRCWMVADCIAFDRHIPSKGTQAPLIWEPSPEVHMLAQEEMRAAGYGCGKGW